jgi:hypothetical protein
MCSSIRVVAGSDALNGDVSVNVARVLLQQKESLKPRWNHRLDRPWLVNENDTIVPQTGSISFRRMEPIVKTA